MPGTLLGALRPYLTKATQLLSVAPEDILGDLLCPPNLHQDLKINILSQEQTQLQTQLLTFSLQPLLPLNPSLCGNPGTAERHLSHSAHIREARAWEIT